MKELRKYDRKPEVIDEIEFFPLSLNDYVEIESETGIDLTKEMFKGKNFAEVFDSKLIREILFRSIHRGNKDVKRDQVGDLALKGEDLGKALSYALNGTLPEEGDGAGNAKDQSTA